MAEPVACAACGETLQGVVRFCPFCGTSQAVVTAAAPIRVVPNPAPQPSAPRPTPSPLPLVPRVMPPPAPASPVPAPPVPASPVPASPVRPTASPRPAPVPPVPPVPRPPLTLAQRQARAASVRKLLLAAVILMCGAVLWHHLTATPYGTLRVRLTRAVAGDVLVDGVRYGPADQPIALPAGRHMIGFAAPDWSSVAVPVRLVDGETRVVILAPVPHRAELRLDSLPAGARLVLDGRRLGRAPASLSLPPGVYAITAALPGYQPAERPVTLSTGQHRRVVLSLQPLPPRRLRLLATLGQWSDPVALAPGERFALLFPAPIRLRLGTQILLLQGGAPVDLSASGARTLSVTAVDDSPVPVDLVIHPSVIAD